MPLSPGPMSAARIGDVDGGVLWGAKALAPFKLPSRGHALTHLNSGKVVLMGRRPGLFASIVDPANVTAPLASISAIRELPVRRPCRSVSWWRYAGHR